ncbi:uncharacterized protein EV422DRAFT_543762 [Fimicolochytrium jonesii]|uniref:uncharacterized protein n=1 Tax=Fimicolochytrium jonesii TaxID=1396493 RepID=UPI0022FEC97A|nr:uncharacterized protein EV422DRAFT_543762 [Fimicolochytrium jonesii]KAI8816969.1 hypothetical protein EV422DRAFT_543762 [Fimicolochytrium jonesii]
MPPPTPRPLIVLTSGTPPSLALTHTLRRHTLRTKSPLLLAITRAANLNSVVVSAFNVTVAEGEGVDEEGEDGEGEGSLMARHVGNVDSMVEVLRDVDGVWDLVVDLDTTQLGTDEEAEREAEKEIQSRLISGTGFTSTDGNTIVFITSTAAHLDEEARREVDPAWRGVRVKWVDGGSVRADGGVGVVSLLNSV